MKKFLRTILLDFFGRREENLMWRLELPHIELKDCKSLVLLCLDGKLGDAVLQSSFVRAIRNANAECKLTIVTTLNLDDYWRNCDGVSHVYTIRSRQDARTMARLLDLRRLAQSRDFQDIDILFSFDPIPMIDYFAFIYWIHPRLTIGLSNAHYSLFQISLHDPIFEIPKQHVAQRFVRALAAVGVSTKLNQLQSMAPMGLAYTNCANQAHRTNTIRKLFINGYGASTTRTFSAYQLDNVARMFLAKDCKIQLTLNVDNEQRASMEVKQLCDEYSQQIKLFPSGSNVLSLFDEIAKADVVLTPDTSVSHIAAATGTPVSVIFDDCDFNPICWLPLSNCAVSMVPETPGPLSRFSPDDLVLSLERAYLLGQEQLHYSDSLKAQSVDAYDGGHGATVTDLNVTDSNGKTYKIVTASGHRYPKEQ